MNREENIDSEKWNIEIRPSTNLLEINFKEIWQYRDLLVLLVRRDFVAFYKQTVLGPLWFFIQPLLTTITYVVIFGKMAGISTDGLPAMMFYLSGVTLWSYFSESLLKTSDTFISNASIFGKVYFPRLLIPVSIVVSNLIKLGIQFLLFLLVWAYYYITGDTVQPNSYVLLLPILVILLLGLSLALGIIFTSLTTKYRDLRFLLSFGVQLLMFATPIIYPLSGMNNNFRWVIEINPLTPIFEAFRYGFLGTGSCNLWGLGYSFLVTISLLVVGTIIFNKIEKGFMDTV